MILCLNFFTHSIICFAILNFIVISEQLRSEQAFSNPQPPITCHVKMVLPEVIQHTLRTSWKCMARTKDPRTIHNDTASHSHSVLDLTSVGLGGAGVLSLGVFIVAGQVVKDVAGPATVFSVFIALLISALSGM